jgi:hypothetical protein
MASPSRMLPPTNSLPPLRCPWPVDRVATSRGEFGAEGDRGGLRNMPSGPGDSGKEAPGLNENEGSAGDRAAAFPSSRVTCGAELRGSIADRGRLPAGLPTNEGAEDDDGRAGKTKCGFGGGGFDRGDAWGLEKGECGESISLRGRVPGKCSAALCSRESGEGGSIIMSGPTVAIFPSRAAAPEPIGNSVQHQDGRHGKTESKRPPDQSLAAACER